MGSVIQKSATLLDSNVTASVFNKTNVVASVPTAGNGAVLILSVFNQAPGSTLTVNLFGSNATRGATQTRDNIRLEEWHVSALGASPTRNITLTYSGGAIYKYNTMAVLECSPLAPSPVDIAQALLWYDYLHGDWPLTLTAAAATAQADELAIAAAISGTGMTDCLINSPAATGWTELFYQVNSNDYQGGACSYKVLSSIQTPSAAFSKRAGTTADHWDSLFVTLKFADAPSGINATLSATIPGPTLAATATVAIKANVNVTIPGPVASSTAHVAISATVAATIPGPALQSTATLSPLAYGTVNVTIPGPTLASVAKVAIAASVTATIPGPSVTASGRLDIAASGVAFVPGPSVSATARVAISASVTVTIPGPSVEATGASQTLGSGTVNVTIAGPSLSAVGKVAISASVTAIVPGPSLQASARVAITASLSVTIAGPTLQAVGELAGEASPQTITLLIPARADHLMIPERKSTLLIPKR